jgi:hypothetical protein
LDTSRKETHKDLEYRRNQTRQEGINPFDYGQQGHWVGNLRINELLLRVAAFSLIALLLRGFGIIDFFRFEEERRIATQQWRDLSHSNIEWLDFKLWMFLLGMILNQGLEEHVEAGLDHVLISLANLSISPFSCTIEVPSH